jgi:hypothetical protein
MRGTNPTGQRPRFPAAETSWWDHLLMDQNDAEKRIAEKPGCVVEHLGNGRVLFGAERGQCERLGDKGR